jgi:hypothetical protein
LLKISNIDPIEVIPRSTMITISYILLTTNANHAHIIYNYDTT